MNKRDKGVLVVLSGFSGAGKGTLVKELLKKYDNYSLSTSMTTRLPRTGEVNGKEYFFVTKDEFERKIDQGELLEYASYCGNYYGTPVEYVTEEIANGNDVLLEIEIQGALKVKHKFPETVLVFVMPPSAKELKKRLLGRGTESIEVIDERLKRASEEAIGIEEYDFLLINDDLDKCVKELHRTLQTAKKVPARNEELIEAVRRELYDLYNNKE